MQRKVTFYARMVGALIGTADSAHADQDIGAAAVAQKEVGCQLSGGSGPLGVGDPLFRNEVVRTGAESAAKLVFLDSTNLALGPISQVVLDRFIYDPSKGSEAVAVRLAKGVFRFPPARSGKTPTASPRRRRRSACAERCSTSSCGAAVRA